ncbi:MAG TPA: ABC transporter permease [Candidatus Acidoferrales bacterium]|nr:ABC transporter permease [Candidatus Acidoferrales bacterium]
MGKLWQDLQYGGRMLRKSPGFTLVAILTLALGIGANTAIFSIVNAVVLRPLPFPNPQQLVLVWETDANRKIMHGTAPPADFLDWRSQNQVFQSIAAYQVWFFTLTGAGEAEQLWGAHVSPDFFSMLGVKPALGRGFRPDEEQPGHDEVVILSHGIWVRHFGGDPGVINRSVTIDNKIYKVVGVLPAGFTLWGSGPSLDLWMPLSFAPSEIRRDNPSLIVFARLKNGETIAHANADMSAIAHRLSMEYPATNQGTGTNVVSMHEDFNRGIGDPLLVLLAAVGLVLLIACANVANLTLSRSAGRQREVAIRSALGARRFRLVRQMLTESVLLGLLGGAVGLLLAYGALRLLPLIAPPPGTAGEIPHAGWIGINLPVLWFTIGIAGLTGIIFGLAPAFQSSKADLNEALKESSRSSTGGTQSRVMRNLLVVAEIALSLILLIGAGTLLRGLDGLLNANMGFNPQNVLSFQVWLSDSNYPAMAQARAFFQQAIAKMRTLPGVRFASAIDFLPLTGWTDFATLDIAGRPAPPPKEEFVAHYRVIDAQYFQTMQIALLKGRYFSDADTENAQGVAIISQALASKYWPNQNPIGQRIRAHVEQSKSAPYRPAVSDGWITIVGLVADVRDREFGDGPPPLLYLPYTQAPSRIMRIVARTSVPPDSLAPSARQAVFSVDKNQPVTEMKSMDELLSESVSTEALDAKLLTFFALLALTLAAIGIYGVISYGVQQRTHEIGIRMALGAQPRDVIRLIVGHGVRLTLIGIVLGVAGSYALTTVLAGLLFGVKSVDIPSSLAAIGVLAIVASAACYIPARRATRVDPLNSLRYE